jgi:hypothetical protein
MEESAIKYQTEQNSNRRQFPRLSPAKHKPPSHHRPITVTSPALPPKKARFNHEPHQCIRPLHVTSSKYTCSPPPPSLCKKAKPRDGRPQRPPWDPLTETVFVSFLFWAFVHLVANRVHSAKATRCQLVFGSRRLTKVCLYSEHIVISQGPKDWVRGSRIGGVLALLTS